MDDLIVPVTQDTEETYSSIRASVITAQNKVYASINTAMVLAYWEIGEQIYKACGENDRAEYGKKLLQYLSDRLTAEFGRCYTVANLRNMRQFYLTFPNRYALRSELSWTHYRLLMRVSDPKAREFYLEESARSNWSSRQSVGDKLEKLKEAAEKYQASPDEIAYIGDDLNDLACIEYCGVTACPSDAIETVKSRVDYVCEKAGGRGAVREFIEYLLH